MTTEIVSLEIPTDFDYEQIKDQATQMCAMAAAGMSRHNIAGAVRSVLETGFLLQQARERLPHGTYLAWLQQGCKLTPQDAEKLIKVAEWVQPLEGFNAADILFHLSAIAGAAAEVES